MAPNTYIYGVIFFVSLYFFFVSQYISILHSTLYVYVSLKLFGLWFVYGTQSVTLGDDEARRRGVQKSVLERKGPPTFTAAAEMLSRTEWRIHYSLAATIDALLAGIF